MHGPFVGLCRHLCGRNRAFAVLLYASTINDKNTRETLDKFIYAS